MSELRASLLTVGYEGRRQEDLVAILVDAGVERVLDVRWRPLSRKRGLSKTALATALSSVGIAYSHDRRLGTPPDIMQRLRAEGVYDWDAYAEHLGAQGEAIGEAVTLVDAERTALLCYEANPQECHRLLVGQEISGLVDLGIRHL